MMSFCSFVLFHFFFQRRKNSDVFFQPKTMRTSRNFPQRPPVVPTPTDRVSSPPRFGTVNGSRCPLHGAWRLRFTTAADATFTRNSSRGTAKAHGWKGGELLDFLVGEKHGDEHFSWKKIIIPWNFPTDI